ncbi:hypothetical protein F7725_024886 [Dissostichus mawsoni]|uniref:Growth factor receptor-bound protein 10 n=1 Tax=Dissostichus mawsoni TaxID=36200 RepID=A0A7J5X9L0_DISMA|nr:hypothetical protein F7725_024886 [Dissostichus mawsoni]
MKQQQKKKAFVHQDPCHEQFLEATESMDRTSSRRTKELIVPGFQRSANQNLPHHHEDDVDLEQLVNDMNSSMESVYSTQSDTALLLNNGHAPATHHHQGHGQAHCRHTPPLHPSSLRACRKSIGCVQPPCPPSPTLSLSSAAPQAPLSSAPYRPPTTTASQCENAILLSRLLPLSGCGASPLSSCVFQIVKVWSEDGAGKVVEIPADMTSRDVCQLLVYKSHCVDDNAWTLVEHHPILGLGKDVQASMSSDSKFLFRKNYAKYEFFRNPLNFFPEHMVAWCQESDGSIPQSQLLQNFLNSSSCPEIQGYLSVKEPGRRSWRKLYMFLRRSGLYYSTKGTSKEPRHLQLLSDLDDSNIFSIISGKKLHNCPTDFQFCIKPSKVRSDCKELKMLCAEDEQSRTCWMTAFRLLKYGIVLYQSYNVPQQRKSNLSPFTAPVRSVSENSLVAMDFSGRTGRVIDNPLEAQSAAVEEGQTWRKRSQRMNVLGSPSPLHPSSLSTVIHRTQVWFHGRIMREEAHKMIIQQGQVDGLFLLRDSQSNIKAFVLTLCHHQKIKHFQILPCEEDGQVLFSLDDGATKFTDLIHLVEFYQLNRGVLPCKLKHPCTAVAL